MMAGGGCDFSRHACFFSSAGLFLQAGCFAFAVTIFCRRAISSETTIFVR